MSGLDAHARPPEGLRIVYKKYQKAITSDLAGDSIIIDTNDAAHACKLERKKYVNVTGLMEALSLKPDVDAFESQIPVYESLDIQALLDAKAQEVLLDRLLHRDLSNRHHKTNVSLHYQIPYDKGPASEQEDGGDGLKGIRSFFDWHRNSTEMFQPLDPTVHKTLTISQFLNRKLRWMTLGGQYDWTNKVYPATEHPAFPSDIRQMIRSVFPDMNPEAAICNFYSPGDTLSLHRDVSEKADRGLVSLSIGCDALFVIAEHEDKPVVLRLHSGDAVYMSERARHAWHGVPLVLKETCPDDLAEWPARSLVDLKAAESRSYQDWRGWLRSKRINLNVRQMYDERNA